MSQEITKADGTPRADRSTLGSALPATRADVSSFALEFGRAWEYAPSPEATDHVHFAPRQELFIGGRWHFHEPCRRIFSVAAN